MEEEVFFFPLFPGGLGRRGDGRDDDMMIVGKETARRGKIIKAHKPSSTMFCKTIVPSQ